MWPSRNTSALRALGLALGLLLMAAAIAFALRRVDVTPLQQVHPAGLLLLACGVAANLLLTAELFWVVTLSFDADPPVRYLKMLAIISTSALLNYLPFQAGSISRAAYLKLRNNLALRQSLLIQLAIVVISILVPTATVALLLLRPELRCWAGLAALAVVVAATGSLARAMLRRRIVAGWAWAPLRVLDLGVMGLRVWAAFGLVGRPVTYPQALAIAAAVFLANLLSVTPNGLGLREWAVAAVSSLLAPALAPVGVLAILVDRGVEALVFVVAGLIGGAALREGRSLLPDD